MSTVTALLLLVSVTVTEAVGWVASSTLRSLVEPSVTVSVEAALTVRSTVSLVTLVTATFSSVLPAKSLIFLSLAPLGFVYLMVTVSLSATSEDSVKVMVLPEIEYELMLAVLLPTLISKSLSAAFSLARFSLKVAVSVVRLIFAELRVGAVVSTVKMMLASSPRLWARS